MIGANRLAGANVTRRLVSITAALLSSIAILGAVGRAIEVLSGPSIPRLSAGDRLRVTGLAAVLGAAPGSAEYREAERQVAAVTSRFNAYPKTTLAHVLPGILLLSLAPLQFSTRIRTKYPVLHRWSGRVLLTAAVLVGLSGLFFGALVPYAGLSEAVPSAVFGLFFLLATVQAFRAIRRRDLTRHREWVIRLVALAMGVGTIRLVGVGLVAIGVTEVPQIVGLSFWSGWLLTLGAAEAWIRATRGHYSPQPVPDPRAA
jgi:uncharacterized membrane protein